MTCNFLFISFGIALVATFLPKPHAFYNIICHQGVVQMTEGLNFTTKVLPTGQCSGRYCWKLLAKDFFTGSPMNISRGCASTCHDAAFNEWITTAGCRAMNCTGKMFCCNDHDRCNSGTILDSGISTPTKILEFSIFIILIIAILSMSAK